MTRSQYIQSCIAGFTLLCLLALAIPVSAHDGEDHGAGTSSGLSIKTGSLSVAELERMVALLSQLVAVLQQQRAIGGNVSTVTTKIVNVVSTGGITSSGKDGKDGTAGADGEDGAHDGHDGHSGADGEDGHDGEDGENGGTFSIEVETHNNKTHVHVRYIDKPEAQFYVNADIDDENELIEDIHEETDLPKSIIEPALVYL